MVKPILITSHGSVIFFSGTEKPLTTLGDCMMLLMLMLLLPLMVLVE